ncbi:hypothetical protein ASPBRDRAFT_39116 [Aspergillus brasiliensis CBS 101740]|uniref:Xaa-Pro dipeptidyl-peptidase C-terminal domain-containing protein n=1 Tax=Aspergillus brasiliensis (strain CBS 101740 / IMI 381727 / IBT 21946) TaxID=767769 RepID=A0A1L9UYB3_ASPBC|nr:hypothetical protein ASPBRDRAFT_39116 [Aspergillus brasiliensis CBS 101740]
MALNKFLHTDRETYPYVFMKNVDIPLRTSGGGVVRGNVYLPKDVAPFGSQTYPVVATYGPYGKDVPYSVFNRKSFDEVNPQHKSAHSAWETPDPGYWTQRGYIVLRVDERGIGQSPGRLDVLSRGTSETFFDVIEWAAQQEWSTGKVGLLGVSYYAATQWSVAARRPKGLAAIIPWEGFSDYNREAVRQGGILADQFIGFWYARQVLPNQYGSPGRWGDPTLEGDLDEETRAQNLADLVVNTVRYPFADDDHNQSRVFAVEDVEVPLLSVANWGGILLHLRGNVVGWTRASSRYKFLRFVVGRHDLPFYWQESAELQQSFFDCFLKDDDHAGWKRDQPRVYLTLRNKDCDPKNELNQPGRPEMDWPIQDTQYTKFFLTPKRTLSAVDAEKTATYTYDALQGDPIQFHYQTNSPLEITGHIVVHLTISASRLEPDDAPPSDIDIFVTLRKLDKDGNEVFYVGTVGDPTPVVKGWLRVSHRKVDESHPLHRHYLPYRSYSRADVLPVVEDDRYPVDVEMWPTNTVLEAGESLVLEIAGHDTQGVGLFSHQHPEDRAPSKFAGLNHLQVGRECSWVMLPVIPSRE